MHEYLIQTEFFNFEHEAVQAFSEKLIKAGMSDIEIVFWKYKTSSSCFSDKKYGILSSGTGKNIIQYITQHEGIVAPIKF